MKKYILLSLIAALITGLSVSCKKEDSNNDDHDHSGAESPVISVNSPVENDTVQPGTLILSGSITHTAEMHGYQIKLRNLATATDVFTSEAHNHSSSYTFNEQWVTDVTDTTHMELMVTAAVNHDGTSVTKTVQFVCLP